MFKIADELDGSGSHAIYSQEKTNTTTKSFILFCLKPISILSSSGQILWDNDISNSPFSEKPIFLCATKESEANIRELMSSLINPVTEEMKNNVLTLLQGKADVEIVRSMFDGKMSAILSGAGGASYQMCTAIHRDLKDRDLVIQGFPINRSITDAIEIFSGGRC